MLSADHSTPDPTGITGVGPVVTRDSMGRVAWWSRQTIPDLWCDALLLLPPVDRDYPWSVNHGVLPAFAALSQRERHRIFEALAHASTGEDQQWRIVYTRIDGGYGLDGGPTSEPLRHASLALVIEAVATGRRVAAIFPAAGAAAALAAAHDFAPLLVQAAETMQPTPGSPSGRMAALLHAALLDPPGWFGSDEPIYGQTVPLSAGGVDRTGCARHAWGLHPAEALLSSASGFEDATVLDAFLQTCADLHPEQVHRAERADPSPAPRRTIRRLGGVLNPELMESWTAWATSAFDPPMPGAERALWAATTAHWARTHPATGSLFDVVDRHWLRDRAAEGWNPAGCLSLLTWFAERETSWTPRQSLSEIPTRLLADVVGPAEIARHAMRWAAVLGPASARLWLDAGYSLDEALRLMADNAAPDETTLKVAGALRRL